MTACRWSMLIGIAAAVSVAAPLAFAAASCDTLEPCAAKACRLDADIAQAKAKGNTRQLASLERARAEMVHCSDDGLKQMVITGAMNRRSADRPARGRAQKVEASSSAAKVKKAQRNLRARARRTPRSRSRRFRRGQLATRSVKFRHRHRRASGLHTPHHSASATTTAFGVLFARQKSSRCTEDVSRRDPCTWPFRKNGRPRRRRYRRKHFTVRSSMNKAPFDRLFFHLCATLCVASSNYSSPSVARVAVASARRTLLVFWHAGPCPSNHARHAWSLQRSTDSSEASRVLSGSARDAPTATTWSGA